MGTVTANQTTLVKNQDERCTLMAAPTPAPVSRHLPPQQQQEQQEQQEGATIELGSANNLLFFSFPFQKGKGKK
jgi:hypothetical protein